MSYLAYAVIFLAAAAIAAPLAKRLGLGAILGYLAAGVAIGPSGLGLIYGFGEVESVMHIAEFGVVLLLFLIGLELRPKRLWSMRNAVFGWGSVQLLGSGAAIGLAALVLGLPPQTAILVGLTLALSSTAFALQTLAERGELRQEHGRTAFAVLLFQDMAVIPLLALLPLLATSGAGGGGFDLWAALRAVGVIALVVFVGRYLLRYAYRLIAMTGVREALTASALLTVAGTALLMEAAGLSAGLGAFLAGVLLADSEYRHELEANISPFEGLLLGIFFVSVGMSLDTGLILSEPLTVIGLTLGLVAVKATVLYLLGWIAGLAADSRLRLAVAIPQGGEFAFVVFSQAVARQVMEPALANLLVVVVTLSMAMTPFLGALLPRKAKAEEPGDYETPADEEPPVIIAGFGRFGQIVARVLRAKRIRFTALDKSPAQVDFVKAFGSKIYYGDASRLDLLRAAGAEKAKAFVLAIDDVEDSLRTAEIVTEHFPNLKIYARARNRVHAHRLIDLGIGVIRRETFMASLDLSRSLLRGLGLTDSAAGEVIEAFRKHDTRRLYDEYKLAPDDEKLREKARAAAEELERLFHEDEAENSPRKKPG